MTSSYLKDYQAKLTTASKAVKLIPSIGNVILGLATTEPPMLLKSLEERVLRNEIKELRLYYMHPAPPLQDSLLKLEYMNCIHPYPMYPTNVERHLVAQGLAKGVKTINYVPSNFRLVPRLIEEYISTDVCMLTVSPMTNGGYFSVGTCPAYALAAARKAKTLILEVNQFMPCVFGDTFIHLSDVDCLIENHTPLTSEISNRTPGDIDNIIADHVMEIFTDASTLQIGIGNVPNAVCSKLKNFNDLGIHSELLSPVMMNLIKQGIVTNKYKKNHKGKTIFTVAVGDTELYDFIQMNPGVEGYTVDYVNDPHVIGMNDNFFSLNSFVEIDLFGQVNAEFIGGHQYSAVGGQLDFIEGALSSKGGRSVLAATSTAAGGKISRIVSKLSAPATDSRNCIQYIATEYGLINLMGKSTIERARLLISLAHPDFREKLKEEAKALSMFL